MRAKRSTRAKKSAGVKALKDMRKHLAKAKSTAHGRWIVAGALAVIAAGVIVTAGRSSPPELSQAAADARAASRAIPIEEPAAPQPVGTTASSESSIVSPEEAAVTITGCLERDQETFRLKDTSDDTPTVRSWKSGFLKRSNASISIVDAAQRLKLPSHVGERVTVRGTLIDREMHVRSLRRVAESCKGAPKA
jgi:hypothetical protein